MCGTTPDTERYTYVKTVQHGNMHLIPVIS